MGWWGVTLAIVIPWLSLAIWLGSIWSDARPGTWPAILGYAYPLALLVVAGMLWAMARLGLPFGVAGMLVLIGFAVSLPLGIRRLRAPRIVFFASSWRPRPRWEHLLVAILLIWMLARLIDLLLELWWQPLFPWDAWTTWLLRARVWSELGHWVPFVSASDWLADPSTQAQTIAAWHYPSAVSLFALWSTLGYGEWNETAAKIPWVGCALALTLGFYGQGRLWGASNLAALGFLWLLVTLPLLDSHLALAGYADLWLATFVFLAFSALLLWARDGDWRQGLLAAICAIACSFIKLEGMVWSLLFIPALFGARLSARWRLALIGVLGLTAVILSISGGLFLESPWGGIELSSRAIEIPWLGRFAFVHHDNWAALGRNLFVYENWHLFFYGLVLVLGWALWRAVRERLASWERAGLVFVGSVLLALYVLFFWTDAYRWAEDSTSVARLFMHFTPVFAFWALTLCSGAEVRAAVAEAPPSVADRHANPRTEPGDRDRSSLR